MADLRLRPAAGSDASALAQLYLRSRSAAMPWLVSPHDGPATHRWLEHVLLVEATVTIAELDGLCGFMALSGSWLEQLYVEPAFQRSGVGAALLDSAKIASPAELWLHVFTRNVAARRFYETAGFTLIEQTDGGRNEEHEPDCTYQWVGAG